MAIARREILMSHRNFFLIISLTILLLPIFGFTNLHPNTLVSETGFNTESINHLSIDEVLTLPSGSKNIPLPQPGDNWTVLVYLDGDNDLEEFAFIDLNEMELVGSTTDVKTLVYVDFWTGLDAPYSSAKCYEVTQDMDTNTINSLELVTPLPSEPNMADWQTLRDFIVFGQTYAPADHYLLVLWDHGTGCLGFCVDETSGDHMDINELFYALNDSSVAHLDIVAFDACLMAQIEVAYELHTVTDFLVFSEEGIPLYGFPYDDILQDLTTHPSRTPDQLAGLLVHYYTSAYDVGGQYYDPLFNFVCLSAVDASRVAEVGNQLSYASLELLMRIQSGSDQALFYDQVCQALSTTRSFTSPEFIDLGGFASGLVSSFDSGALLHLYATNLVNAIDYCVINESHLAGSPGATGLSIFTRDYGSNLLALVTITQWDEFIDAFLTYGDSPNTASPITPSGTHYGYLDSEQDSVFYVFTPSTTGSYTIHLDSAWTYYDTDFDLYLYDSTLDEIAQSLSFSSTEQITINLEAGTNYFIEVYSYPSTIEAGVFLLTFYSGNGLPFNPALLGLLLGGIVLAIIIVLVVVVTLKRRSMTPSPPAYSPAYRTSQPTTTTTQSIRFCPYCGGLLPPQAQYCPNCGASAARD
jgi:hypothetical protein